MPLVCLVRLLLRRESINVDERSSFGSRFRIRFILQLVKEILEVADSPLSKLSFLLHLSALFYCVLVDGVLERGDPVETVKAIVHF